MKHSDEILHEVELLFQEVLDDASIRLHPTTTANDIAEWDSVNHLVLLYAIEQKYHIKFDLDEMINFRKVGDICESVLQKLAS